MGGGGGGAESAHSDLPQAAHGIMIVTIIVCEFVHHLLCIIIIIMHCIIILTISCIFHIHIKILILIVSLTLRPPFLNLCICITLFCCLCMRGVF